LFEHKQIYTWQAKGVSRMKNKDRWTPSKYIFKKNKLVSSTDPDEVTIGSRLITNIIAHFYDTCIPQHVHGLLIDLGCGKVPLFAAYKNYIHDVICVDWPYTIHKNDFLDYECDLNNTLPFPEACFDTVILSDVLEHIARPEELWKEISRILKPSGKVLLNVPFYYWLHEMPFDYYRYTEYALKRFAEQSSCRIVMLTPLAGAVEIIVDILAKNIQYLPLVGPISALLLQYLSFNFWKSRPGRWIAAKTSSHFPLGYFMVAEKTIC
jgi:SAM-dependent methyltransferase